MKSVLVVLLAVVLQLCACGYLRPASRQAPEPGVLTVAIPAGRDLMAGVGRETITPEGKAWLGAYYPGRKSTGVHDDLEVRVLSLRNDNEKLFVFVTLDLMGFSYEDVLRLRESVDIPGAEIFVISSHTHSGPDTIGFYGPTLFRLPLLNGRDENYIDFVIARSGQAIARSLRNLTPVALRLGARETDLMQSKIGPIVDREVSVLLFKSIDTGQTVATLVNFACHPTTLSRKNSLVSSDFVGPLRDLLDRELDTTTLFVNGALGGVTYHRSFRAAKGFARATEVGRALGAVALGAAGDSGEIADANVMRHGRRVIRIPLENRGFQFLALLGFIQRRGVLFNGKVETEVNILRMGDVTIVMTPGEILPELGLEAKRMFGPRTQVWSLGNDALGYIVGKENFGADHPGYGYVSSVSVGPETAPLIMDAVEKIGLELALPMPP
jgi:hypothetical protein